ncbi:MAG: hypothetical protein LUF33_05260 [Clostridiales bacterium]|nr:hypothetical protein [Clostridiales bacterium]
MYLNKTVKNIIEKSLGKSICDLIQMDYDDEIKFLEENNGEKPSFSKEVDHRIFARGNHLIAQKRIMTMEEVDEEITRWKKDERKKTI